jgi:hypothetical protein
MGTSPSRATSDQPIWLTPLDRCPILPFDTSLLHQHLHDALSSSSSSFSSVSTSFTNRFESVYIPKALISIILEYSREVTNHIISIDRYQHPSLRSIGWISSDLPPRLPLPSLLFPSPFATPSSSQPSSSVSGTVENGTSDVRGWRRIYGKQPKCSHKCCSS